MEHDRSGLVVGLTAYLVWGFLTVYWKQLHHFDAFELIGHRIVWSTTLLAVVLVATRRWRTVASALRTPRTAGALALASLVLAGNWTSYVYAVVHGHVVETALGYFIAPIGTMLVGVFALHERLRPAQWAGLGLAATAVVELAVAYGRVPWLALAMAVTWTAYGYLKKRIALAPVEGLAGETLVLALPAAAIVLARQAGGHGIFETGTPAQIVLVVLSGVATAVPLTMFAYAAKRLPLTVLGPMNYIVPTINFLLGVLAYHEELTASRVVGFSLVWVALAVIATDQFGRSRAASAELLGAG